jgi:hypothetical protein
MIKLNDTTTVSINVLAEGELDQVVGGRCHGGYRGWGKGHGHCGGKQDYDKYGQGKDYDKGGYGESSDDSSSDDSSGSFKVNNQVIALDITINQVAV